MPVNCRLASLMVVTLDDTPAMASTVWFTACWMSCTWALMSPVALAVCCASVLTSDATTAKPRPAAPARAASMVALSASSEVCEAIASISLTTVPMRSAAAARLRTVRSVRARSVMVRAVASLAAAASAVDCTISASEFARGVGDRGDVAARGGGGIDRVRGALAHIDVARAEIGGGDLDFLGRGLKHADELVDGGAKALGEEAAAGMVQPGFRLAAAVIDRERVGIDQDLPHLLRRHGAVAERAAADPLGQRGIAVAAGDLGDGADDAAQHLFAPPCRRKRADQRRDKPEEQAPRAPGDQDRDRSRERRPEAESRPAWVGYGN